MSRAVEQQTNASAEQGTTPESAAEPTTLAPATALDDVALSLATDAAPVAAPEHPTLTETTASGADPAALAEDPLEATEPPPFAVDPAQAVAEDVLVAADPAPALAEPLQAAANLGPTTADLAPAIAETAFAVAEPAVGTAQPAAAAQDLLVAAEPAPFAAEPPQAAAGLGPTTADPDPTAADLAPATVDLAQGVGEAALAMDKPALALGEPTLALGEAAVGSAEGMVGGDAVGTGAGSAALDADEPTSGDDHDDHGVQGSDGQAHAAGAPSTGSSAPVTRIDEPLLSIHDGPGAKPDTLWTATESTALQSETAASEEWPSLTAARTPVPSTLPAMPRPGQTAWQAHRVDWGGVVGAEPGQAGASKQTALPDPGLQLASPNLSPILVAWHVADKASAPAADTPARDGPPQARARIQQQPAGRIQQHRLQPQQMLWAAAHSELVPQTPAGQRPPAPVSEPQPGSAEAPSGGGGSGSLAPGGTGWSTTAPPLIAQLTLRATWHTLSQQSSLRPQAICLSHLTPPG